MRRQGRGLSSCRMNSPEELDGVHRLVAIDDFVQHFEDVLSHLSSADHLLVRLIGASQIRSPVACSQDALNGGFNRLRLLLQSGRVAKQHRRSQNRAQRISFSRAGNIGSRTVNRLI
jgi:hypothetical protein